MVEIPATRYGDWRNLNKRLVVKVLSRTLYNVINYRVSIDVAFKRACKNLCKLSLAERESLYVMARDFISDYVKVRCFLGAGKSYSSYVRAWIEGNIRDENLPEWCRYSVSHWFYEKLSKLVGEEVHELLLSLSRRVLWARINTLKASEEKVLRSLSQEGVDYVVDSNYPYLIQIIKSPKPVRLLNTVRNYELILQDKASVAVVEALNPQPGDNILDMAFAPGMKTSLIMSLTDNKAKVVALDISYKRSLLGRQLLEKLGVDLSRVQVVVGDSRDIQVRSLFDKVLLDAPCSNSGAIPKDPGLKITLTESKVTYYSNIQKELISKSLKLGKTIVYSTCSLMPEEGEEVANTVSENVRFYRPIQWASEGYKSYDHHNDFMRLYPHKHLTEGFFICYMISKDL
ncbi:MAG: RsmB/NOP family class I SAM-dependent RNA methyltransferase [Desulfurococcaceae archaeon TW002]